MTSKARTRGDNVLQATFLFEKEPNEHIAVVAKLDPPKARTPRTSHIQVLDAVPAVVAAATIELQRPRARKASRMTEATVMKQEAVVSTHEPSEVRTQRTSHRKEAAVVQPKIIEPVVLAPEVPLTKRRASKSMKAVGTDSAASSQLPHSASIVTNGSEQAEVQPVDTKQRHKPRAAQPMVVAVTSPSSEHAKTTLNARAELEQIQAKEPRKRRSTRTAAAMPSSHVEASHVPAPTRLVQPTPLVQQASDVAMVQETEAKQRRTSRPRATTKPKEVVPAAEVVPVMAAPTMPSLEPLAPVEIATVSVSTADATPDRGQRKRTIPTTGVEDTSPPVQKKARKPRSPIAPEEPKTSTAQVLPNNPQRELPAGPMFLMSYDDSPKRTLVEKIEAAMMAYQSRFARRPNLVLVNTNVAYELEVADVSIERRSTVPPNNFWAGMQPVVRAVVVE